MRTVTNEETEAALLDVCEKLEVGMECFPKGPSSIFAALLEMHGLWRGRPFQVDGEKLKRGEPCADS